MRLQEREGTRKLQGGGHLKQGEAGQPWHHLAPPHTGGRLAGSPGCLGPLAAQDPPEGAAKVLVEDGVDDGVQRAIAVADPEEELEEAVGHLAVLWADGTQAVAEEEREPAEHEDADDHSQHEGEPPLPAQLRPPPPPLCPCRARAPAQEHLATQGCQHPGTLWLLQRRAAS